MWGQKLCVWKPGRQGEHRPGETGEKGPAPSLRLSLLRATSAKWPALALGLHDGRQPISLVSEGPVGGPWGSIRVDACVLWAKVLTARCVRKGVLLFAIGRAFGPGGMIRDQILEDLDILYKEVWGLFVKHGGAIENTGDYLNYESPLEDNFD